MFQRFRRLREEERGLLLCHLMLRAAVLCLLVWKLVKQEWGHAGLCALTLALFCIPALAETVLKLRFPPLLEVVVMLFAACANLCGEMLGFYLRFRWWDMGLHLVWGFLAGVAGCAILRIVQRERLTPLAAALSALGFAALTSVCWEFFEYFMDAVFQTDMQKSCWLPAVTSLLLNPAGTNQTVTEAAESVLVNGEAWQGFLDPGLTDTMSDLALNFAGSILAAVLVWLDARPGSRLRFLKKLMPTRRDGAEKGAKDEKN